MFIRESHWLRSCQSKIRYIENVYEFQDHAWKYMKYVSEVSVHIAVSCKICQEGYYQSNERQTECLECELGHKCPSKGLTGQLQCPANTYSGKKETNCRRCPKGKKSAKGSASCGNACTRGPYYVKAKGCPSCLKGTFSEASGMKKCEKCLTGTTPNRGRTQCQGKVIHLYWPPTFLSVEQCLFLSRYIEHCTSLSTKKKKTSPTRSPPVTLL